MKEENFLFNIAISIIIALIIALIYFYNYFPNIIYLVIFSLILALVSLTILAILSSSDNGLTRNSLNKNISSILFSIIGNIFLCILTLIITLSSGNILSAILVGLSSLFMILNLLNLILLLYCSNKY